jgi:hypothetical protein
LVFHLVEIAAARARGEPGPPPSVVSGKTAFKVRRYMREILAPNLLRAEALIFASRQTTHAAWIAGYILARRLERIAVRDVMRSYRELSAPEDRKTIEAAMASLLLLGWLAELPTRNADNRPTAWQVNPRVHVMFAQRAAAERDRRDTARESIADYVATLQQEQPTDAADHEGTGH